MYFVSPIDSRVTCDVKKQPTMLRTYGTVIVIGKKRNQQMTRRDFLFTFHYKSPYCL